MRAVTGGNDADRGSVRDQAAFWAERMQRPVLDAVDAEAFDDWMNASATHRDAFARVAAMWDSRELTEALTEPQPAPRRAFRWRAAAGVAIAACLLFALTLPLLLTRDYRTAGGAGRTVTLADGSHVMLSGNARLHATMLPWRRQTRLDAGEAYFDVRHDGRPFTVDAGTTSVRVLGTAFDIDRQSGGRVAVAVFRGAVRVEQDRDIAVLRRGDSVLASGGRLTRQPVSIESKPAWLDGWFVAQDVPLAVLIDTLNRHLAQPIAVDEAAMQHRVSGRYHVADPQSVLTALEDLYHIRQTNKVMQQN